MIGAIIDDRIRDLSKKVYRIRNVGIRQLQKCVQYIEEAPLDGNQKLFNNSKPGFLRKIWSYIVSINGSIQNDTNGLLITFEGAREVNLLSHKYYMIR